MRKPSEDAQCGVDTRGATHTHTPVHMHAHATKSLVWETRGEGEERSKVSGVSWHHAAALSPHTHARSTHPKSCGGKKNGRRHGGRSPTSPPVLLL